MADKVPKLNSLTGLRFIAAAGIVLVHSGWFGLTVPEGFALGRFVDLFFVLSGFILTYSYPRLNGFGDRGRFLLARFARLWPAHAFGLLLMLLLFRNATPPVTGLGPRTLAWINLAMIHSWIPIHNVVFSYNGPSWSIATEFGFYICFLFLIPWWERTWHVKLLLACVLSLTLPALVRLGGLPEGDATGTVLSGAGMNQHPLMLVWEFTAGMSAALIWRNWSPRWQIGPVKGTLVELGAVALVAAVLYFPLSNALSSLLAPYIGRIGVMLAILVGPYGLLIAVLASERGWVSRLLGSRPAVRLGEISFTIYILHFILIHYYSEHFQAFASLPGWLAYAVFWIILLLVCHVFNIGVEAPVRRWLVGLWPRPAQPGDARPTVASLPGTPADRFSHDGPPAPGDARAAVASLTGIPRLLGRRLAASRRWLLAGEALVLGCLLTTVVLYAKHMKHMH
jgi:peptidoglycan/LPS O-acetylase OafA/YrhL